jgi:hypothetical protein
MFMTSSTTLRGITGILRPYKDFLERRGVREDDQIVYYGCTGTCTPFVELLAITLRGLRFEQVFVPLLDESKAKKLHEIPDVGMQVSRDAASLCPKVLVFMGGLAMPYMPVSKEQARDLIAAHGDVIVVGVCFMSMFATAGWPDTVPFDLIIDGTLDPVTVTEYT